MLYLVITILKQLQVFRVIYTGKSSALDGKRVASGASQAEKNGMKAATAETVAYAAVQASSYILNHDADKFV